MINEVEFNDSAHKLLSDNRDRYFAQSAATRNGVVPPPIKHKPEPAREGE